MGIEKAKKCSCPPRVKSEAAPEKKAEKAPAAKPPPAHAQAKNADSFESKPRSSSADAAKLSGASTPPSLPPQAAASTPAPSSPTPFAPTQAAAGQAEPSSPTPFADGGCLKPPPSVPGATPDASTSSTPAEAPQATTETPEEPQLTDEEKTAKLGEHSLIENGGTHDANEIRDLQQRLAKAGIKVEENGLFDEQTEAAVREYQAAKGLKVDGKVGQQTWGSFFGLNLPPGRDKLKPPAPSLDGLPNPGQPNVGPGSTGTQSGPSFVQDGKTFRTHTTGYFPDNSAMEGGYYAADGSYLPPHTLQAVQRGGNKTWVAVAGDPAYRGRYVAFPDMPGVVGKVVDTGGRFGRGTGTRGFDICVANRNETYKVDKHGRAGYFIKNPFA